MNYVLPEFPQRNYSPVHHFLGALCVETGDQLGGFSGHPLEDPTYLVELGTFFIISFASHTLKGII